MLKKFTRRTRASTRLAREAEQLYTEGKWQVLEAWLGNHTPEEQEIIQASIRSLRELADKKVKRAEELHPRSRR